MDSFKKLTKLRDHLQDLTLEEARSLMKACLEGRVSQVKMTAFLTAMRIKGETVEELLGIIRAIKEKMITPDPKPTALDLAPNYDGKVRTLYILPSAVAIASRAGVEITHHYARGVPVKQGTLLVDVLKGLGNNIVSDDKFVASDQRDFCPSLHSLLPLRRELGFRTFINTVEKLLSPFGARCIATSVFHRPFFEKIYHLLQELGFENFVIIKGVEGSIEPLTDKPTLYMGKDGILREFDPKEEGIELPADIKTDEVLGQSVSINRSILKGDLKGPFLNWSLLTAGFLIYAAGKAESPFHGYKIAEEEFFKSKFI